MGQPVSRLGDMCNESPSTFAPVPLIEGSPNVFTNSIPTGRLNDSLGISCMLSFPFSCRGDFVTSGSGTVFVNGLPIARLGDSVLDQIMVEGSDNVFAGG